MRLSSLGRWARPTSPPVKVRRATTAAAPRLSAVAVSGGDCRANTGTRNNRLGNGDVVTDRDVGRERRDDGAVLLERQVHGAPDFHVVGPVPTDGKLKGDRGVPARLGLAARAAHRDIQALEFHAVLLENDDDVLCSARGGCQEEE